MPDFLFGPTPHTEAVEFLKDKPAVSREVFDQLLPELKARAFTVTGIEDMTVTQAIRDRLAELPQGRPWDEVKKDLVKDLHPWLDGDDDEENENGTLRSEARAELLLRTHGFQAYQASAYNVMDRQRDVFPYWQYHSMEDDRVRPTHAALDGIVLPADHEFWQTHFPPWEWNCRCQVIPISQDDFEDIEKSDEKKAPDHRDILDEPAARELSSTRRLVRNGVAYNVSSPAEKGKEGAFTWDPKNLRIPLDKLRDQYLAKGNTGAQTFQEFEQYARNQKITEHVTLWEWLSGHSVVDEKGEPHDDNRRRNWLGWQSDTHPDDAKRAGPIGQRMARKLYGELRASKSGPLQADVAAAEIAAVAGGRKPLYHELLGTEAARDAARIGRKLPGTTVAAEREGHLIIYRPEVVKRILDSDTAFYRPNGENDEAAIWRAVMNDEQGELMGYGARTLFDPQTVSIRLFTGDGHLIAGFRAPRDAAEILANDRGLDYARQLGRSVRYLIRT
jgi:SPP1 gp7 family putative phage head morphogenesis protein